MLLKNVAHLSGVFIFNSWCQAGKGMFSILYINNSIEINGYSDLKSKLKELAILSYISKLILFNNKNAF